MKLPSDNKSDWDDVEKVILYIEDDDTNRLLVRKILQTYHMKVIEAEDGLKGLQIAKREKLDLILLDINMEGMNGYEIATRLRMLESCKCIPLVALTANILNSSRDRALISGCDGFISKPIDRESFVPLLLEYMEGRRDCVRTSKIAELMVKNNNEVICHLEDQIKDLKRANEELKELDKLKSNFVSLVSHELRTPLSPIVGYMSFLFSGKYGKIPENIEKILRIVYRNSKRLEKILYDLFTLNLLEQKVNFMNKEWIDLAQLLKELIEDHALIFAERNLSCFFHEEGEIPKIYCDEMKISEVFSSIIGNAIKYTENGGVLDIYVRYPSRNILKKNNLNPKEYVEVVVKDNGIGIPEDKLTRIFEKFVELSDIETHHTSEVEFMGGGMGLGLSISKGIIKDHKGFIWAENRKEKGSKFYVIFPLLADCDIG